MRFRKLKSDEIECRIGKIKDSGLSLLLYKDARVDQNILDETVGAFNWQREHSRDNANCTVSIWDSEKKMWISKEDTGTESFTEKDKGLASDSFKRACFNWGIGRELYTAPFIWIPSELCSIKKGQNGKLTCKDGFIVTRIEYSNDKISKLVIKNKNTGHSVFNIGNVLSEQTQELSKEAKEYIKDIKSLLKDSEQTEAQVLAMLKVSKFEDAQEERLKACRDWLKGTKE